MKTSDHIKQIRELVDIKPDARYYTTLDGEQIPGIYNAHMSAIETERQLEQARRIVAELFRELEGSCEGPCVTREREDEINGLLLLWGINPRDPHVS